MTPESDLSQAELFDVFSNARRRMAVRVLNQRNGACDLRPLVEQVAAWENETTIEAVTRAQRRRVYISLYQTHLPMLEDHGIVDWDPDSHRIELLMSPKLFEPYLDSDPLPTRGWEHAYAAVVGLGGLLLVFAWLSVGPLSTTIAPVVGLSLTGLVFVVATIHHVHRDGQLAPTDRI